MANQTRQKKKKKKKGSRIRSAILSVAVLLAFVFGGLYVAAKTFCRIPLSNLADVFTSFSVRDNSTFPFQTDADAVVRMAPLGSGVAVLRSDKLIHLTKSGAVLLSAQHTFITPAMDVYGGRVLLYDRGGTRYRLYSKTELLAEGEADGSILTAAVASNGRYAIAVGGTADKSVLTVYEPTGKKIFQFKCALEYVTDIAFTNTGIAVTVAGVKDAEAYSKVLLFSLNKTEPTATLSYDGVSLFHIHTNPRTTVACGSSLLVTIGRDGTEKSKVEFGSDTPQFFCADEEGKASMVLLTYGNEHASRVVGLQKNGDTAFDAECGEIIRAATRSAYYTCVLTDSSVLTYNNSGKAVGTLTLKKQARDICLSGHNIIVLFNDGLESFPAAGNHTQKENS